MIIQTFVSNIPKWEEFQYEFQKIAPHKYRAVHKETREEIIIDDTPDSNLSEEMFNQLELFKRTPEEGLGEKIPSATLVPECENLIYQYEILIVGAVRARMIAAHKNPDGANIRSLLDWLESTDFFVAPASSVYHDAHVRGLLLHTLRVYNKACDLWKIPEFADVNAHSFTLVALVHDWCKIGLYEQYEKNVKNDETGQWEKKLAYRRSVSTCIGSFGHGTTSLYLASRLFSLSNDEALAIRWHMGEYNVCDAEMNELHLSNETFPIVQMIQFADRLSITKYLK